MKIAVNRCFGGFDLSVLAKEKIAEKKGIKVYRYGVGYDHLNQKSTYNPNPNSFHNFSHICFTNKYLGEHPENNEVWDDDNYVSFDLDRTDPELIAAIEELGEFASGRFGNIQVIEVPNGIDWEIDNYDGIETVREIGHFW